MPGDSRVMARILDTRAARSVISRIVSAVMTSNAMMVQAIFRMAPAWILDTLQEKRGASSYTGLDNTS